MMVDYHLLSPVPKTGDVFQLTFGYESTNVRFFQIKSVKKTKTGKYSARIVQVVPSSLTVASSGAYTDTCIGTLTREPLPLDKYSTFVKDNNKGDRKIIHISKHSGQPYISFDVGLAFRVPFFENEDKVIHHYTTSIY